MSAVPGGDGPRDPEGLERSAAPAQSALPAGTRLGPVHLTVSDLPRSLEYYGGALGLRVISRDDRGAALGVDGRELLVLVEERGARPAAGFTGLYHFALLVPRRADLAT